MMHRSKLWQRIKARPKISDAVIGFKSFSSSVRHPECITAASGKGHNVQAWTPAN